MDTEDKSKEQKNKKLSSGFMPVLYIIGIIILVIFIVVEAVVIIGYIGKSKGSSNGGLDLNPTPTPEIQNTPSNTDMTPGAETPSGYTPVQGNTETPGPSSAVQTPGPTNSGNPAPTDTPKPTSSVGIPGIDDVAARIVDPSSIDFSFLDSVPKGKFEDSPADSYDWYFAPVDRDENGNIYHSWDRWSSTLNYLKQYGGIYRKNEDKKVVYLTFDCGYENGNTMSILDTLKEKNVQSIFFVTGGFIDYGEMTKTMMVRMLDEGHLIGSHTEHHYIMPELSNEQFVEELNSVYRKLKNVLGEDFTTLYYRPPQGACTPRDLALASYLGYHTTFWSFAYGDYNTSNQPDPAQSLQKMKDYLHPGCVYLLHAVSSTNAAVLGDLIDYIRAEGYEIRRIDQ